MYLLRTVVCYLCCAILIGAAGSWGAPEPRRAIEDHIRVFYPKLVKNLEMFGFRGPFGEEVARYALVRQLHEDGLSRPDAKSIVGLWPGCWNKEVMDRLTPYLQERGLHLKQVGTPEGGKSYAIYGPHANVWSGVAIALVWEKYLEVLQIDHGLKEAWRRSQHLSEKIAVNRASESDFIGYYNHLGAQRRKVLETVNRRYNPDQAGRLNRTVITMGQAFDSALLGLGTESLKTQPKNPEKTTGRGAMEGG
ncbi:MAG: hypothetical protein AB1646_06980 [Thermodesulfobacteriota bacterium]